MFKQTKKALLLATFTLIVCLGMFIGTTYAWFTDSVSSAGNIIQTGNLDVNMQWAKGTEDPSATTVWNEASVKMFTNNNWEPGYVEARHIKISNEGTLALKYKVVISTEKELSKLAEVIDVYYMDPAVQVVSRSSLTNKLGTLKEVLASLGETGEGELLAGASDTITLVLKMQDEAGNEYEGLSLAGEFTIKVVATQLNYEKDSFGSDYDAQASVYTVEEANQLLAANEDAMLVNCNDSDKVLYIPYNYTGTLTLYNVNVAGIQVADAPSTISLNEEEGSTTLVILGDVVVKATEEGKSAITGKSINISGTGNLTAIGKGKAAFGIGGLNTESINIEGITIDYVEGGCAGQIGTDTKYYKDAPEGGAAIGSGFNGATITLNNVTVKKAIGGSKAAAIGARYHVGVNININDSEILYAEGGATAAAIGGSRISGEGTENGTTININNSEVNAKGGVYGAGIGSGYDTHCQATQPMCTINIKDSKITAEGGQYAAGVGTGYHMAALSGEIVNSEVNAKPGETYYKNSYTVAMGVGFGVVDPAREGQQTQSNIKYNDTTVSVENAPFGIKTIEDLKAAFTKGGKYQLVQDIEVAKNETLTIANGVNVVLDLNGKKISSTADKSGNQELFLVKGDLTVVNGELEYTALNNQGWSSMITIFDVTAGGKLTLEKVAAKVSGSDMNFIVHLNNWGEVTLYVNNCEFTTSYVAIRAFNSGYDMNNVTVENSKFFGGRVFWVHNYTSEGKGDDTLNLDIYNNNNTTDNANPVRFGFSNSVCYDMSGNLIQ